MKVFISDKTKAKLEQMIKNQKGGSISVRKYNPETDPITNVINGIKLEDCHREKHKTGKFYTIYISKEKLKTYVEGEGIMSWLPKIFKGVAKYAPAVVSIISDVVSSHKQNAEQERHNSELEKIARGEALKCGVKDGGFLGSIIPAIVGAVPALIDIFSKVGAQSGDGFPDGLPGGDSLANSLGAVGNITGTILGTLFGSSLSDVESKKKTDALAKKVLNRMIKMKKTGKTYNQLQFGKAILPGLLKGIVRDQKFKGTYETFHKDPLKYPLEDLTPEQQQSRIDEWNKLYPLNPAPTTIDSVTPSKDIVAMPATGSGCKCFVNATQGIDDNTKNSLRHVFRVLKQFYKIKQSKKGNGIKLTHRGNAIYLNPQ